MTFSSFLKFLSYQITSNKWHLYSLCRLASVEILSVMSWVERRRCRRGLFSETKFNRKIKESNLDQEQHGHQWNRGFFQRWMKTRLREVQLIKTRGVIWRRASSPWRDLAIDYPRSGLGGMEIFHINALKRASQSSIHSTKFVLASIFFF